MRTLFDTERDLEIAERYQSDADVVLFEGDCKELLEEIPSDSVDLVITSPPYNIGKIYERKTSLRAYLEHQEPVIAELYRTLSSTGSICWEIGNYIQKGEVFPLDIYFYDLFKNLGMKLRNRIIWRFNHGLHASKRFSGRYEVILWFTKSNRQREGCTTAFGMGKFNERNRPMIIAAEYSFNRDLSSIQEKWPYTIKELESIINSVDAHHYKTKKSNEKTMPGRMLYSPPSLNSALNREFKSRGWRKKRVLCEYPTNYYRSAYSPKPLRQRAFREMDFLKERLGIEVQFGKYAFMVYNVCAKMTIFHKLDFIDAGVEIVPVKSFANEMSTGVSYFEQFVWDLQTRGVADIDIPVLIFGIDA